MNALLIVSADDLGLTDGVCRAVLRAHLEGVVTATSVLAVGRSFDLATRMLRDHPGLDAGAHLAIVGEDPPMLSAREIPTLVDKRGALPLSYRTVVARGLAGRLDPADVHREFAAQLERIGSAGVRVSHLDTHQHTHLWPPVASVLVALAAEHGVPAVRLPRSNRRTPLGVAVNALARRLRGKIGRAELMTTDAYAGLDEAGSLDSRRFAQRLAALGRQISIGTNGKGSNGSARNGGGTNGRGVRTVEINAHPGEPDDPDLGRFEWGYHWADELAMLCTPATRRLIRDEGLRLGSFPDLRTREAPG